MVVDTIAPRFYSAAAARAYRSRVFSYLHMPQAAQQTTQTSWVTLLLRTNDRVILNEAELIAGMRRHPQRSKLLPQKLELRTFTLGSSLPFLEQMRMYASTRVLVSYHGAQLTNSVFMMDDAVVIEIFNCRHFADTYERTAIEGGHRYFSARPPDPGCEVPSPKSRRLGELNRSVPPSELAPFLDRAMEYVRDYDLAAAAANDGASDR